ncbi:MAG: FecR family protein [Actinobacteria bacterium]|nr:FecR family protein [Actinomycetota bacterium]
MEKKHIPGKKHIAAALIFLIIFLSVIGFSNIAFAQNASLSVAETNLIHGVVPAKVTAHLHYEWDDAAGLHCITDWYFEFWNIGQFGGDKYSNAKITVTNSPGAGPEKIIWDKGYFTGGPDGVIHAKTEGYNEEMVLTLKEGKTIDCGGWGTAYIDNPEAFNGWDDQSIEGILSKPTIQLIIVEGPVALGNDQVRYTIKALVSGNPVPTVEFSRTPQDSISYTDTPNVITVVAGKNEALALTATATNSEGSATASLGFPPPTIELVIKEGPVENPDKTFSFFVEVKVTGTPEPIVEFRASDPAKVKAIDNLNVKVTLSPGENLQLEATAKNEFGQADSKIELSGPENAKPAIKLEVVYGPIDEGNNEYSFIVEAKVTGFPEPIVKFNRDDSDGSSGKNKAAIKLIGGEEFILTAKAENSEGEAEDSIVLISPSVPKISLEIVEGPEYTSRVTCSYKVKIRIESNPPPEEFTLNIGGKTSIIDAGKGGHEFYEGIFKLFVGVTDERSKCEDTMVTVTARSKNDTKNEASASVVLPWIPPPEGMFTETYDYLRISKVKGKFQIKREKDLLFNNWNMGFVEKNPEWADYEGVGRIWIGDEIKTADEPLIIEFLEDGSKFMLAPNSWMKITESGVQLKDGEGSFTITKTKEGIKTLKNSFLSNFSISTITGTSFVIDARNSQTLLKVLEGTVEIYSTSTGINNIISGGELIAASETGLSEKTAFSIDDETAFWENVENGGVYYNRENNPCALNSSGNFLVKLQNNLAASGIPGFLIIVVAVEILFLLIAIVALIIFVLKTRTG